MRQIICLGVVLSHSVCLSECAGIAAGTIGNLVKGRGTNTGDQSLKGQLAGAAGKATADAIVKDPDAAWKAAKASASVAGTVASTSAGLAADVAPKFTVRSAKSCIFISLLLAFYMHSCGQLWSLRVGGGSKVPKNSFQTFRDYPPSPGIPLGHALIVSKCSRVFNLLNLMEHSKIFFM